MISGSNTTDSIKIISTILTECLLIYLCFFIQELCYKPLCSSVFKITTSHWFLERFKVLPWNYGMLFVHIVVFCQSTRLITLVNHSCWSVWTSVPTEIIKISSCISQLTCTLLKKKKKMITCMCLKHFLWKTKNWWKQISYIKGKNAFSMKNWTSKIFRGNEVMCST